MHEYFLQHAERSVQVETGGELSFPPSVSDGYICTEAAIGTRRISSSQFRLDGFLDQFVYAPFSTFF